ncbi:beta-lactamase family protein [Oscillatoriales cyanobacterium LEGE 11467]|uniref:Beta-lactamase family protein n=1 Tax=Zarconia navalis LEGE 11467 TaxID=1828826 RepID=A0A928W0R7_9CYAN|nr:serine hydrolase domain-containing protein [Zarconia navalis]MBE9041836.1 beta-lactamase family protein [Zarconia navalis LEGE 11467]
MSEFAPIDEFIQDLTLQKQIPGLSVSVVREGEPLLMKGYGIANLEHDVPATEKTVYEIASVGKTFTAMVVMMLVEEGTIELDRAIADYLDDLPPAWHCVTVRHILSHQSGIPSYTDAENYWDITHLELSKIEVLALVKDLPLKFQPGESVGYDNTGYYLLGMMLEQIYRRPYAEILHDRLFAPLGMKYTRMNSPKEIVPHRAAGYRLPTNQLINKPYYSPSVTYSAGGQLSSIEDMVKYERELCQPSLLKPSTLDLMWTPNFPRRNNCWQEPGYAAGLGWWILNYQNRRVVSHNGSIVGFASNITRFIDDRITVILLCNLDKITRPDAIAKEIVGYYCQDIAGLPVRPALS